ncbi:MAG: hypothetical protein QM765_37940 [Myxococcales bacterium]
MNLIEPVAVASFGAGASATAGVLLGLSAPWIGLAAVTGGAVAVLVLTKAMAARTSGARRAALAFSVMGFLSVASTVAALRLLAKGRTESIAAEIAKSTGLMLAGGLAVTLAVFALVTAGGALLSRRNTPRGELDD